MTACDNPFATDRVERVLAYRPEWMGTSWEEIDNRWQQCGRRAALVGPHGVGKTTFIDAWIRRFSDQQILRLFLNREKPTLTENSWLALTDVQTKLVVLDGEEQLGWYQRRKFYQMTAEAKGLLVSRHRVGKLPLLMKFNSNIEILHLCVKELAPDYYEQLNPDLSRWWKVYRGNIREILLRCYDAVSV